MRFHQLSEDLFANQTTIRALRTLTRYPGRQFTGRELAAESDTPPTRTLESLRKLSDQGLVTVRTAGRSLVWRLEPDHALVPGLRAWFEFERGLWQALLEEIRSSLAPLPFVQRVVLFGSVARRDERPGSDVDLFVLVDQEAHKPRALRRIREIEARIRSTFTNPLAPLIYDQREWESKANLGVVRNIEREGLVLVEKPAIKTEKLSRDKARIYLHKAEEFARAMQRSAAVEEWNAAGLAAVHAVISAADAVTTAQLGLRSRASNHEDVVQLLRTLPSKEAVARADKALGVLEVKNQVEYEARTFERAEAVRTVKQADRFVAWVRKELSIR